MEDCAIFRKSPWTSRRLADDFSNGEISLGRDERPCWLAMMAYKAVVGKAAGDDFPCRARVNASVSPANESASNTICCFLIPSFLLQELPTSVQLFEQWKPKNAKILKMCNNIKMGKRWERGSSSSVTWCSQLFGSGLGTSDRRIDRLTTRMRDSNSFIIFHC